MFPKVMRSVVLVSKRHFNAANAYTEQDSNINEPLLSQARARMGEEV
jgi:hypothetical protein